MTELAKRKRAIPQYGTVVLNGIEYYRTRVEDSDGNRVALYAKTPEKLYDKELEALEQIDSTTFRRRSPTVAEYCEKWLLMQSVHVRATTLTDYTSKVRRHIIGGLGDKRMADVSLDDIQLALVPVSKKSASVYKSVVILCKSIFRAAKESHVIDEDPTIYLDAKGGVPQEERQALTDEQVERLLDTIRDLPPYVFVMIGLYAGLRREEILALQWDSVYLDAEAPYLTVRRAWHTEHNSTASRLPVALRSSASAKLYQKWSKTPELCGFRGFSFSKGLTQFDTTKPLLTRFSMG
ncbi:hypothetical protein LZF93_07895 [Bifidobacterium longum]|nr:hypothetical protein [Bifidobacterium longum]UIP49196.1 hypothetical protein LZF93_07895 [Bifidobacterium longum]